MKLPARYRETKKAFTDGGMSDARICIDQHLDRKVIVKSLNLEVDQKRLEDEVAALSAVRSKHVVELYDVIKDDDGNIVAIIEEFLPGPDLNASIPIEDPDELMHVAYAIAAGVGDIHDDGRVHRDLKPGNMKYDSEGCLKIFDFGLSRPDDVDASTIGTVGTIGYLAPELCAANETDEVTFSQAVDVFAYGAIVLKLARGSLPSALRNLPPALPNEEVDFRNLPCDIPVEVADVLNRCLDSCPENRPPIREIERHLGTFLLKNKHRAALVVGSKVHVLDAGNRVVKINVSNLGSLTIKYDGLNFIATEMAGSVFLNNFPVVVPHTMPGACVITLGELSAGRGRRYVTFDISHPEVVI